MKRQIVTRSIAVVALLVAMGGFVTPQASAAPLQADRSCQDYIPTDLALNVASAAPGQTIEITGLAYPGDTVSIRIATFGGFPIVLATPTAGADGRFTASITIPADFAEGTYNITVSSPNCSAVAVVSLVVRQPSGRCTSRLTITQERGDTVEWVLLGVFDVAEPLTVTLEPMSGGAPVVVFDGPYPASGTVTFDVPVTFADGRYRIVESGTGSNGNPRSARCGRLRVSGGATGTTTTTSTTSTTSTTVPNTSSTTSIPSGVCDSPIVVTFQPTVLVDWTKSFPWLGLADVVYTSVVDVELPAGTWNITDAKSSNGFDLRLFTGIQPSEIWEIEFLAADGSVLARSNPTEDLDDYVSYALWIGDLGTVTLPEGVVGVRAHHLPDLISEFPQTANSVTPVSFTICSDDGQLSTGSSTTTSSTPTSTSTTTASTLPLVAAATTVPGSSVGTGVLNSGATNTPNIAANNGVSQVGSNIPDLVLGTDVSRSGTSNSGATNTSNLAITGSTVRPLIIASIALIALGGLLALNSRRRRQ